MGEYFGRAGRLLPDREMVRTINVMETVALAALERGYAHMMLACNGDNPSVNENLGRRWFAVAANVGGLCSMRMLAHRFRKDFGSVSGDDGS